MTASAERTVFGWLPTTRAGRALLSAGSLLLAAHVGGVLAVRVGSWPLPPIPLAWIGAGVAAAAGLLALRARAVPPRATAVALTCAAAAICAVLGLEARHRLDDAGPDIRAEVGRLSEPGRAAETVHLRSLRLPHTAAVRRRLGRVEDLVVRVEGTLTAPRSGTYVFSVFADDQAELTIDGAPVLSAAGREEGTRDLAAGPHVFALRYVQVRGPARLEVAWDRPGLVDLLPLEHHLATGASAPATPRAVERTLLLAWVFHLAAWVLVASAVLRLAEGGRALLSRVWSALRRPARPETRPSIALAASALLVLLALQAALRDRAADGLYFHPFTSEFVMQTVSVDDLRVEPVRSLWYLHIQPPVFDLLRALFAATYGGTDARGLMVHVDQRLLATWALVFAALTGLVAAWVSQAAGRTAGIAAGAVWLLHPAALTYATVLDTTLLSAALFAWYTFELWRWRDGGGSAGRLAAATLALFFTRSVFQWPFVLLTAAALWTRHPDLRGLRRFLLLAGIPVAAFVLKQHALFGVTMTSSFGPDSFCKGLGTYCAGTTEVARPALPDPSRARVLSRTAKLDGEYNYNQIAFLRRSFSQRREYLDRLSGQPVARTLAAFTFNAGLYLRPSSAYGPHVIVDRLPWRPAYDTVFSGLPLVLLAVGAVGAWTRGRRGREWREGLALAVPILYVVAATIALERGENHRYKFFVEPVLFVFVAVQAAALVRRAAPTR